MFHNNQKGTVLLIALLVLAAIMATASGLSILIVGQLKISGNFDASLQSYYAAESGLERSLWVVRDQRENGRTLLETVTMLGVGEVLIDPSTGVRYTIDAGDVQVESNQFQVSILPENRSAQVDLFDPDGSNFSSDVYELRLSWADDCSGCSRLEITAVSWAEGGTINVDGGRVEKFYRTFGEQGTAVPLDDANVYSIRLKNIAGAGGGTISSLTLMPLDRNGIPVSIPSRLVIRSTGESASTRQVLQAMLPWRIPPSGLYDYVLFSEEGIDK